MNSRNRLHGIPVLKANSSVGEEAVIANNGQEYEEEQIVMDGGEYVDEMGQPLSTEGNRRIGSEQRLDENVADINNIAEEIEIRNQEEGNQEPWENFGNEDEEAEDVYPDEEMGRRQYKRSGAPATVLMTPDSLRGRPQLYASAGRPKHAQAQAATRLKADVSHDVASDSPGMKSQFRVLSHAALLKADAINLFDDGKGQQNKSGGPTNQTFISNEADAAAQSTWPWRADDGDAEEVDELVEDGGGGSVGLEQPSGINRKQITHHYQQWPLYWDRPVEFQEACDILVGSIKVRVKLCNSVPQNFRGEGTFVINLQGLPHRHDVGDDGLGSWGKPMGRSRLYTLDKNGRVVRSTDERPKDSTETEYYTWKCMLKRYQHPSTTTPPGMKPKSGKYIKKVYTALSPHLKEGIVMLAVVTYEWIGVPFNFRTSTSNAPKRSVPMVSVPPSPARQQLPQGTKSWEEYSFRNSEVATLPATCTEYHNNCPLYATGAIDFNTAACIILGGLLVDPNKLCNRVPQGYRQNGTFVIDIRNYLSDAELRIDNNGLYRKPSGHSRYYKIDPNTGDAVRVDNGNKLIEGVEYDIQILSKRYEHTDVNGRFVRKIYTGRSPTGDRYFHSSSYLAVITYFWKGEAEWFPPGLPQKKVRVANMLELDDYPMNDGLDYEHMEDMYDQPGPSTAKDNLQQRGGPPNPKRSRQLPCVNTEEMDDGQVEEMRRIVHKKEYENQERLGMILDRVSSLMDRMERAMYHHEQEQQVWVAGNGAEQEEVVEEHTYTPFIIRQ